MRQLIILGSILTLISACTGNQQRVFEENRNIEGGVWARDAKQTFEFTIDDTSQYYHIYYNVRNTSNYPFYNLYLRHSLTDDEGKLMSSRLQQMHLFNEKTGKPLGNERFLSGGSFGDLFDHKFQSLIFHKFPKKGKYAFTIHQHMRNGKEISGLFSIGCRVDKAGNSLPK